MKISVQTISVVVEFTKDELVALTSLLNKMSIKSCTELGLSDEQAELMYLIYRELSDYVDDK